MYVNNTEPDFFCPTTL